jgi:hypothetical protein
MRKGTSFQMLEQGLCQNQDDQVALVTMNI